jgi:hypothetical protein
MFNKFQKNIKTYVKKIPDFQPFINAKSALYFGLTAYWGVILFGTFFNI